MALQPKFSLLSLSQLANIKLEEQYKNFKVASCIQTFHINRLKILKLQLEILACCRFTRGVKQLVEK